MNLGILKLNTSGLEITRLYVSMEEHDTVSGLALKNEPEYDQIYGPDY